MMISRSVLTHLLLSLTAFFGGCDQKVLWENLPRIRSSAFQGSDFVWIVTEREGALLFTSDSGKTWNKVKGNAVNGRFDSVAFIDRKHGWAVNDIGQVWRSDDGGNSWIAISKLTASRADDWQFNSAVQLDFNDDRNGWILETLSIWRTADGGVNWRKVFPPSPSEAYVKGQPTWGSFLNSKNVWVSGASGEVYDTKDGAETWRIQTVLPNGDFTTVYFLDGEKGWLLGYVAGETGSYVYRTIDGGHSWSKYPIAGVQVQSICFINANEGWAVGSQAVSSAGVMSGVLFRTADGGRSWNRVDITTEERSFDRVHFVDTQHGWLFGRKNLYQSDDGGKAWRIVRSLEHN